MISIDLLTDFDIWPDHDHDIVKIGRRWLTQMKCPKYEILRDNSLSWGRAKLFQIRASRDFGEIKAGELGGFISSEINLSHEGESWVFASAYVLDAARVFEDAQVMHKAIIYDHAEVSGRARVSEHATVFHEARIFGNAIVSGRAQIFGEAQVYGEAQVGDRVSVWGKAQILGGACLTERARAFECATICSSATIDGDQVIRGNHLISQDGILQTKPRRRIVYRRKYGPELY
jgi:UDP-3-O-[3-hydroxymyristoyl] glucosamine N-acyltransferase